MGISLKVPFIDLQRQYLQNKEAIDTAVQRVLASGRYILGEETSLFEQEFSAYFGARHAVGVASGTDAITLALKALGVGAGDEVITVSHTAVATIVGIERCGAKPVFVDIDPASFTIDPSLISRAITPATKAIIPVHLYGHPADMKSIMAIAESHELYVIEDCAQAHGASYLDQKAGTFGHAAAFSFYPTKNLGGVGDGGIVTTHDPQTAEKLIQLRQYGWNAERVSEVPGLNSRLDELQAAILRIKLGTLERNNTFRRIIADRYKELLSNSSFILPEAAKSARHVYHLFVIRTNHREGLLNHLKECGITAQVHYTPPVHLQKPYQHLASNASMLKESEQAAHEVLSLPIFPQMRRDEVEWVCKALLKFKV